MRIRLRFVTRLPFAARLLENLDHHSTPCIAFLFFTTHPAMFSVHPENARHSCSFGNESETVKTLLCRSDILASFSVLSAHNNVMGVLSSFLMSVSSTPSSSS